MKYAIIPNEKRACLLERVIINKEPLRTTARQLKIKFPSAKSIIRNYKKTGRIFSKKSIKTVVTKQTQRIQADLITQRQKEVKIKIEDKHESQEKSQKIGTSQNQFPREPEPASPLQMSWMGVFGGMGQYPMAIVPEVYGGIENWMWVYYQNNLWV